MQSSLRAYESLWRSRAEMLRTVSLVLSTMSDVRAAFSTGDQATIRDTAGEIWPRSRSTQRDVSGDRSARQRDRVAGWARARQPEYPRCGTPPPFPEQTSGFVLQDGRLYQMVVTPVYVETRAAGQGLLNVLVAGLSGGRRGGCGV